MAFGTGDDLGCPVNSARYLRWIFTGVHASLLVQEPDEAYTLLRTPPISWSLQQLASDTFVEQASKGSRRSPSSKDQ